MKIEDILNALPSKRIEDLLGAIPSRDDLAHYAGLQTRSSAGTDFVAAFGIFGAGLMLGAGLALLFAPKPGSDLRNDLASKGQDLAKQGQEIAGKVGDKVNELSDRLAKGAPTHVGNA